jgi:antitoxin FitA
MEPNRNHFGGLMPSLTLKNIPEQKLEMLKRKAQEHHRSLQGEMMHLIDEALNAPKNQLTLEGALARAKAMGLGGPNESTRMIREDRDAR